MGRDPPRPHQLLHLARQLLHEAQPARHPARAPVKPRRQLLPPPAEAALQLREQPPLLERRLPPRHPQRAGQHQRLRLAHRPHHRPHGVLPQPLERACPRVAVDEHPAIRRGAGHHNHRHLLAAFGQCGQQPALGEPAAHPQALVAQLKLVVLDLDDGVHDPRVAQAGSGLSSLHPGLGLELLCLQLVGRASGLSVPAGSLVL